jgi:ABC-type sugar transport system substrate-binding protein
VTISAQFATSLDSPEHIAVAERLGYARAWLFDTPQQSPDVWMMLALAAERTERIGLGPGVLVPALRHPMVNAAGAAALEAGSWAAIATTTVTGTAPQLQQRLSAYAAEGITEIVYQPTGPDIAGELEAFINVANTANDGRSTTWRQLSRDKAR